MSLSYRYNGVGLNLRPVFEKIWLCGGGEFKAPLGDVGGENEVQGRECGEPALLGVVWEAPGKTVRAEMDTGESPRMPCRAEGSTHRAWPPLPPHPRLDQELLGSWVARASRFGWQSGGGVVAGPLGTGWNQEGEGINLRWVPGLVTPQSGIGPENVLWMGLIGPEAPDVRLLGPPGWPAMASRGPGKTPVPQPLCPQLLSVPRLQIPGTENRSSLSSPRDRVALCHPSALLSRPLEDGS